VPFRSPGCFLALHAEEEVFWYLPSVAGIENHGILVVEALVVVGKGSISGSGCIRFTKYVAREGELRQFVL
jgi:hypothetical protein